MSERDQYDETNEPEFEMGVVDGDETRNRPAMGATLADSTQELDLDWKGNSAATDFLGIDGGAPVAEGQPGLPADSWLHGIEAQAEQAVAAADETAEAAEETAAEPVAKKNTKRDTATTSGSPWMKLAAAGLLVALAGGGYWYWKTQYAPNHQTHVDVATKPTQGAKPTKPVVQKPTPPVKTPGGTKDPVVETPVNTDPTPVATDPQPADPVTEVAVTPDTTVTETPPVTPTTAVQPNNEPVSAPSTFRVPPPSTTPIPGAVRRATDEDFANMWREQTVPLEAISGAVKLRTLNVGQVRVMLDSGEYFEGQLYAVGQERVWLDLELGRIAFEASTVRDITRIARPANASAPGKKGPDLSALPHVEVKLPGGWMAGRLIGREGNTITIVTDDGIRMVIESDEVRPITGRMTRVLGTVEKLGGFTGKPAEAPKKP